MKANLLWGQYQPKDSFWHRRDARIKSFLALSLIILLWIKPLNLFYLAVFSILSIVLGRSSRQDRKFFIRNIWEWRWLLLLAFFFNLGWPVWHKTITPVHLKTALFYTWRLVLAIRIAYWLNWTTKPLAIVAGMVSLLRPLRRVGVPVEAFALVMGLTLRFFPLIWEEGEKVVLAQKLRGADFRRGTLKQRWFAFHSLIVPLLISVFRRADHLASAIEARGFRIGYPRTYYLQNRLNFEDWLVFGLVFTWLAVSLWPILNGILK